MLIKMTKKKEIKFDYEKELTSYELPVYFIAGIRSYIQRRNLQPKSKKDLDKIVEDFSKISAGGD